MRWYNDLSYVKIQNEGRIYTIWINFLITPCTRRDGADSVAIELTQRLATFCHKPNSLAIQLLQRRNKSMMAALQIQDGGGTDPR